MQAVAIGAAVALSVLVAGPVGGLEHLLRPLVGGDVDELAELAIGIIAVVLLVPGLLLWAWRPHLRPAGTAMTASSTLALTVEAVVEDPLLTSPTWWLAPLWLLVIYQFAIVRRPLERPQRPITLIATAVAAAGPWAVMAARTVALGQRGDVALATLSPGLLLWALLTVLLLLPVLRLRTYSPAGVMAAAGGVLYALHSLRTIGADLSLPVPLALIAVAAAVTYVGVLQWLRRSTHVRLYDATGASAATGPGSAA